jgi:hypothetical protein
VSGFESEDAPAVQQAYGSGKLFGKGNWRLLEYLRHWNNRDVLGP